MGCKIHGGHVCVSHWAGEKYIWGESLSFILTVKKENWHCSPEQQEPAGKAKNHGREKSSFSSRPRESKCFPESHTLPCPWFFTLCCPRLCSNAAATFLHWLTDGTRQLEPQLLCCWHVTKAPHISTSARLVHWASSVQLFPGGSADHCQIRKLLSALQPERLQGKEFHLWKVWFYYQGYISPSESLRVKKSFLMIEEGSKSFNFLQEIYANCTERYNWKYTARKMYLGKMYSHVSGISNRFGRWQDGISLQMTTR